jgi:hypothetical protein
MYPRVPKNGKPANIGPQFDNVGSFVLKPETELPVLRGGVGELCVSGKLVGKGYLNRPDLTKERFPTLASLNERVYRTGDLVRILHDGSFIFLGRADDQVKLRGQRLELSEINEVIKKSSSSLQEVVTLVLKHSAQQKEQLVTFFVNSPENTVETSDLISSMRDACNARLPGYMVPTHFVPLKALPLNANNKADSKQLGTMYNILSVDDLQRLGQSSQSYNQWSAQEHKVIDILASTMDIDASILTRGSNIFELGLDSISIVGFSRALQKAGLENAKLSIIKNNPHIGTLVQVLLDIRNLDNRMENAYVTASQNIAAFSQRHLVRICKELCIESSGIENVAPCTPVQEGMIYRFLESERPLYFNKFEFLLNSGIDPKDLLVAWNTVAAKLQILRTKFVDTDDGYAQVVLRKTQVDWKSSTNYDSMGKSEALKAPYEVSIVGNLMTIRIFHGLYDGNSLTMLLHCVIEAYQATGNESHYGPEFHSCLPYGPLAIIPGAKDFWTDQLQHWSYNPLIASLSSSKNTVASRTLKHLDGFDSLRKRMGVTPQAMVQGTWLSVFQTISSGDNTIGVITSGRAIDFQGAEMVIGPLFNTVPFHVKIDSEMTVATLISKCHKFNMQMQDFQHTALKEIQKWSPALPGQSLFDTLFVFQRSEPTELEFMRKIWTQIEDEQAADVSLWNIEQSVYAN